MVERYADAVKSWRAVWIDGGFDEWYLDIGAQAFQREMRAGLPEERIHFELFDAGHGGIDYRYPAGAQVARPADRSDRSVPR